MKSRTRGSSGGEYLLEFVRQGAYVRIAAIDPVSGVEVVTVGDASRRKSELTRVAVQKLEYVLKKKADEAGW
jgi:hypothetical protein